MDRDTVHITGYAAGQDVNLFSAICKIGGGLHVEPLGTDRLRPKMKR